MAIRMRPTKRSIETLEPGPTDTFAWDTDLVGYGVKVAPGCKRTYSAKGNQPFGGLKKVWRQIRKLSDLQDMRPHDLRHSFASVGVSSGASLYMVGKLFGHADAGSTKLYAHLADDPVRQAADEISSGIAEMMRARQRPPGKLVR